MHSLAIIILLVFVIYQRSTFNTQFEPGEYILCLHRSCSAVLPRCRFGLFQIIVESEVTMHSTVSGSKIRWVVARGGRGPESHCSLNSAL